MKDKTLIWVKVIFGFGILLVVSAPFILTLSGGLIDFSNTGAIGDTIGGTTAPIASLLGSILVFYALKAQIDANTAIQKQLENQKNEEIKRKTTSYIGGQIDFLSKEIDSFRLIEHKSGRTFTGQQDLPDQYVEHIGSSAILELVKNRLAYIGDKESDEKLLSENPQLKHFYYMLLTFSNILDSIDKHNLAKVDRNYFCGQVAYLFEAKIVPGFHSNRIKKLSDGPPCEKCGKRHNGIPSLIFHLIENISERIENTAKTV
jgi:hypothetical protein